MAIYFDSIVRLYWTLGVEEAHKIYRLAKRADALELANKRRLDRVFKPLISDTIESLIDNGAVSQKDVAEVFLDLFARNAKATQQEALESTGGKRLARIPKSLPTLREWWDYYRKQKKIPSREKALADKMSKEFLKKVQSVWNHSSEEFREGGEQTKAQIVKEMKKRARTSYARAKTIVETETTYYYNATRKNVYDSSPDVTHYLFIPVRDAATTKWCRTRDGIVLEKGTQVLEHNTPPCHWNCRSEIVPLTPLNPRHKKLIDDPKRKPSNRRLEPLPKGWKPR